MVSGDVVYAKSLILPHMSTAVRDTVVPQAGQIIFNTTTKKINFASGAAIGNWEAVTSA